MFIREDGNIKQTRLLDIETWVIAGCEWENREPYSPHYSVGPIGQLAAVLADH
jgi:hypothetical protein